VKSPVDEVVEISKRSILVLPDALLEISFVPEQLEAT
jgi:hypothetical protein